QADEALAKLRTAAGDEAQRVEQKLSKDLTGRLLAVEAELEPIAIVRSHQRFRGPFGAWLATWDFIRYQLPRSIREFRLLPREGQPTPVEQLLVTGQEENANDQLRDAARRLQDVCFSAGLPVARWCQIAATPSGETLLGETARTLQAGYEAAAAELYGN